MDKQYFKLNKPEHPASVLNWNFILQLYIKQQEQLYNDNEKIQKNIKKITTTTTTITQQHNNNNNNNINKKNQEIHQYRQTKNDMNNKNKWTANTPITNNKI